MTRRCPQCATTWPDDLSDCPHDGTPLEEPIATKEADDENVDLVEAYGCEPGDELGQYRLIRLIGFGGMAAVFEGEHSVISRPVAVKVLHREVHDNAEDVRRFFHEARAISDLKHQGIVECLDFADGTPTKPPYLVMELVRGQPLSGFIDDHAPLPVAEAVTIVTQICDAMAAVHAKGILHRDLKPSNIMVLEPLVRDETLRVKLLDFGVAKYLVTDEHFLRTATGAVLGTPEYMAPEVVRGQKLSPATDVYSLGGVLYQLLTGRLPFVCDTLGELIQHHLRVPAESPSQVVPEPEASRITSSLDKLVLGCLAKSPDHRVATMEDLKVRLRRAAAGDDTDVVQIPKDLPPLSGRRTRWLWLGLGVMVAAVMALGLWLQRSRTGQPSRGPAQPTKAVVPQPSPDASAPTPRPRTPRPQTLRARLVSRPAGASVFRNHDGRFLGNTPLSIAVPPAGVVRVVLRLAGHRDLQMDVRAGTKSPLVADLTTQVSRARPMTHVQPRTMSHRPAMGRPSTDVTWGTVDPFGMNR